MDHQTVVFVGNSNVDVVLRLESYPCEDSKNRVKGSAKTTGGNACNSSKVAAQLAATLQSQSALPSVHLLTPGADPHQDEHASFLVQSLSSWRGLAPVNFVHLASTGTPVSYVIESLKNATRTILHERTLPELDAGHILKGIETAEGFGATDTSPPAVAATSVHIEVRSVQATVEVLRTLRADASPSGELSMLPQRPRLVSIEIEKARPDGDVESLIQWAHCSVVSKDYAGKMAGPEALAAFENHLGPRGLLLVPWGEGGVYASLALPEQNDSDASERRFTHIHVPAHAPCHGSPASSGGTAAASFSKPMLSTLGAGDSFNAALVIALSHSSVLKRFWGLLPASAATHPACDRDESRISTASTGALEASESAADKAALTAAVATCLRFAALVAGEKVGCPSLDLAEPLADPRFVAQLLEMLAALKRGGAC